MNKLLKTNARKIFFLFLFVSIFLVGASIGNEMQASGAAGMNTQTGANAVAATGQFAGNAAGSIVTSVASPAIASVTQMMQTYQQLQATLTTLQSLSRGVGIAIADPGKAFQVAADNARHAFQMQMQSLMAQVESGERKLAALQQTSTAALAEQGAMKNASYLAFSGANTARQALSAENAIKYSNVSSALCPGYTFKAGLGAQIDFAKNLEEQYKGVFTRYISGNDPLTKNSHADAVRQLAGLFVKTCNSPVLGGVGVSDPDVCLNRIYELKASGSMSLEQASVVNTFLAALYATTKTTPASTLRDGTDFASLDTDTLSAFFLNAGDQANAIEVFAATARMWASEVEMPGATTSVTKIREALVQSGAMTQARVDEMLPENGASLNQWIEAMGVVHNAVLVEMQTNLDTDAAAALLTSINNFKAYLQTRQIMIAEENNRIKAANASADIGLRIRGRGSFAFR